MVAGPRTIGVSEASPETKGYFDAIAEGRLVLKHCGKCAVHLHPRRIACPTCGSIALEWEAAAGDAAVYSFSTVYRAPVPEMEASVPYIVGIVRLEEGVHLFGRIFVEDGATLVIDAPARLEFRLLELGERLPVWVVGA
jgi:uncharacterized OB-fold protein